MHTEPEPEPEGMIHLIRSITAAMSRHQIRRTLIPGRIEMDFPTTGLKVPFHP